MFFLNIVVRTLEYFGYQVTHVKNYIDVGHLTSYGHVSAIYVNVGEQVSEGQAIGLTGGTTGTSGAGSYSNGPHLHFEVLLNNVTVDPEDYLE